MENSLFDKIALMKEDYWMVYAKRSYVRPFLGEKRGQDILDAGCGTGFMLPYLARWGKVVGLDSSAYALSLARQGMANPGRPDSGRVSLVEADLSKIPFPDSRFDVVLACEVLYHRAVEDDERALRECARVLKKGGRLIVIDSAFKFLKASYDDEAHAARRYSLGEMSEKLARTGLEVRKASYIYFFIFPAVVVIRFFRKVLGLGFKESEHIFKMNRILNGAMRLLIWVESHVAGIAGLPFGTSVFCVGVKGRAI